MRAWSSSCRVRLGGDPGSTSVGESRGKGKPVLGEKLPSGMGEFMFATMGSRYPVLIGIEHLS
jgi:hypothetical protein